MSPLFNFKGDKFVFIWYNKVNLWKWQNSAIKETGGSVKNGTDKNKKQIKNP